MPTAMEHKTLNNQDFNLNGNFLVEKISIQQLIDLAVDSADDHIGLQTKQELIQRGKDSIPLRIQIKKACKQTIANLESVLKELDKGININGNKNLLKSYKTKFLNLLSIVDRLQLEWQKYDLRLKH